MGDLWNIWGQLPTWLKWVIGICVAAIITALVTQCVAWATKSLAPAPEVVITLSIQANPKMPGDGAFTVTAENRSNSLTSTNLRIRLRFRDRIRAIQRHNEERTLISNGGSGGDFVDLLIPQLLPKEWQATTLLVRGLEVLKTKARSDQSRNLEVELIPVDPTEDRSRWEREGTFKHRDKWE